MKRFKWEEQELPLLVLNNKEYSIVSQISAHYKYQGNYRPYYNSVILFKTPLISIELGLGALDIYNFPSAL